MDERRKKRNTTRLMILLSVCGALLLTVAVGSLVVRCQTVEARMDELFIESLEAHTRGKGTGAQSLIDDTLILLEDASRLLTADSRPLEKSWIDPVLGAMNLGGRHLEMRYLNLQDMTSAEQGSEETAVFGQVMAGEAAVSQIVSAQEDSYFLVVQPVERSGQVAGAVQAKINARLLTQQGHDSTLFRSVYTVIAGENGQVICGNAAETTGLDLMELGMGDGLSQDEAEEFVAVYQAEEKGFFRCNIKNGRSYAAWAPIAYNGWRVVQFSQSPDLRIPESSLVQTVIMLVSLLVCGVLAAMIWWQRAKLAKEKLRYDTLSEFRDTLIFEYDCRTGDMEFTSNALDTLDLSKVRLSGVTDEKNDFPVFHPDDIGSVRRALQNTVTMIPDQIEHDRIRLKKRDGSYSWYRSQYKAVFTPEGKAVRLVGTLTDISAQIDREQELRHQAQQDPLTDVYNRAGVKLINARLEQISRGILFMLDLDDFKSINDTYGHAAGDQVLMAMGQILKETFRTDDIVARIGGDEFVAFLSGSDNELRARQKAQELLDRVKELHIEGINKRISISVGISRAPVDGRTFESLSAAADEAMYGIKNNGKGGFALR